MAHVLFIRQLTKTDVNLRRNCLVLTEEDFLAFKNVLIPRDQELFNIPSYQYPFIVEDFPFSSMLWSLNCKIIEPGRGARLAGNWGKFVVDKSLKKGSWLFFEWNQELYRMRVNFVSPNEEPNEEEQILFDAMDDIVEDSVVGHTGGTTDPGGAGLEGTADPEGTTGTGGTAVGVQHQVCVRDFVPSALACLMKEPPEADIVKNFLLKTLHLRGREKKIDKFTLEEGVIPASFQVLMDEKCEHVKEILIADYGGSAIGRVVPMDSGFGWITLLKSYVKRTRDHSLADMPEMQQGIKLILNLCLSDGVYTSPSLLCADACCVIDRRMDIYGYPIEIQALFSFALRSAKFMLKDGPDNKEVLDKIIAKIKGLCYHTRTYYWLDFTQLNNVYRYKTEEYSHTALNKFNVSPGSIPDWLFEFMPLRGGYFIGNVCPACMDFRWFLLGNCIAILSSLLTPQQASEIMDLIEERWDEIIEEMPLKITYPALESDEWKTITGYESKNTWWSYHNGGFWPVLLWLLGAACFKTRRPQMARNAIDLVEKRLCKDGWSEYDSFFASAILAGVGGSKSMAVDRSSDSTAHSRSVFFIRYIMKIISGSL